MKPVTPYAVKGSRPRKPNPRQDPDKLAFVAQQRCLCWATDPGGCNARVEVCHDRVRGGKRDDRRTWAGCANHHRLGPRAYHVLGRSRFQQVHRIDLDAECLFYQRKYEAWKAGEVEWPPWLSA